MAERTIRREDLGNRELVRRLLLDRLATDSGFSFWGWGHQTPKDLLPGVVCASRDLEYPLLELADEVMWDLLMQRVITPGSNASNPAWPRFRLTEHGKRVVADRGAIPHDASGYMASLRTIAPSLADDTCLAYVSEALDCFNAGCHTASTLLLGVAAEQIVLNLVEVGINAAQNAQEVAKAKKATHIADRHRWLCEKLANLPKAELRRLPDQLDLNLTSLYCMIRRQRNELGHPQEKPPSVDRDHAFSTFTVFPVLAGDAEALAQYCRENGW